MTTMAYVLLGLLVMLTVCLVLGAAKLERRATEWQWLHPPNDDGISILEVEDDADSGKSS